MALPPLTPLDPNAHATFGFPLNWGIQDPEKFYKLIQEMLPLLAPGYYLGDNLLTWQRNLSLFHDKPFVQAWETNIQNNADRVIAWRRFVLACAGYHCVQLDGDFVECGAFAGSGMKTVMDYLGGKAFPKRFYGYDTFDYHPVAEHAQAGQDETLYPRVVKRFEGYDQVTLVKGLIPESFKTACPDKIAYLHIDLNSATYEVACLEHLFDKVVPSGLIVLDDYEWSYPYQDQKIAEDKWFEARKYRVMPLPTGQGLVIKR
ncbi:MAG: class I SAM-dependent methyltransferase [Rhodospirillaceae bacterium]|nr:class I SAM-dependent methyltransferase [Rhodospirillaceae bacterium]